MLACTTPRELRSKCRPFQKLLFCNDRRIDGDTRWELLVVEALVIHSDTIRRGKLSCSNRWVNKLHENVVWSMRGAGTLTPQSSL